MMRRLVTRGPACACVVIATLTIAEPGTGAPVKHRARCAHAVRRHRHRHGSACRVRGRRRPARSSAPGAAGSGGPAPGAPGSALSPAALADVPVGSPAAASTAPAPTKTIVWSDEFDGPAGAPPDSSKWGFDTGGGGWGNKELESYTARPSNASLDGAGHLTVTARAEKYTGADGITRYYTSARLQTLHTFQFEYGVVQARIRVPTGQGLVAQFWALGHEAYEGSGAWPSCGEIDTMEVLGSEASVVNGTLHAPWPWAPNGVGGTFNSATTLSAGFHTYSMQWSPNAVSFLLDGAVYETVTPAKLPAGAAWPFQHPYFLLLDLAVGGVWPGSPNASTQFPARMLIDWVRVWQ
jgi:beta-glucanase (GH16 family)